MAFPANNKDHKSSDPETAAQVYGEGSLSGRVSLNLLRTLSGYAFSAVTILYVSRVLQPAAYGRVAFASTISGYASLLAGLGLPIYGMRCSALARKDKRKLSTVYAELFTLSLFISLIVFLLLFTLCSFQSLFRTNRVLILVLSVSVLSGALGCEWLYRGLEQYRFLMSTAIIARMAAVSGIFLLVKSEQHIFRYAVLLLLSTAIPDLMRFFHIGKYVDYSVLAGHLRSLSFPDWKLLIKKHLRAMSVFFLMSCAVSVYSSLDLVMLSFFKTEQATGLYSLVFRIKTLFITFSGVLQATVLPAASARWEGQPEEFRRIIREAVDAVAAFQIPAAIFCILFADEILLFAGGSSYLPASNALRITALSFLPIGFSNILGGSTLIPAGAEKKLLAAELAGAVLNFGLNLIFIPRWSLEGAAVTTVLAEVVVWLLCRRTARQEAGIYAADLKPRGKILIAASAAALCAVLVLSAPLLQLNHYFKTVLGAAVFVFVYFGLAVITKEPVICRLLRKHS